MELRSILPFNWNNVTPARRHGSDERIVSLWRDVDHLFDDFFQGNGFGYWPGPRGVELPIEVSEDDKEIVITAELPGVDEKDVEVRMVDDLLTIRGEKKAENEHKGDTLYMAERTYGSFMRTLRIPFRVEPEKVDARFSNGVLTVALPKPEEARHSVKKIEVKSG